MRTIRAVTHILCERQGQLAPVLGLSFLDGVLPLSKQLQTFLKGSARVLRARYSPAKSSDRGVDGKCHVPPVHSRGKASWPKRQYFPKKHVRAKRGRGGNTRHAGPPRHRSYDTSRMSSSSLDDPRVHTNMAELENQSPFFGPGARRHGPRPMCPPPRSDPVVAPSGPVAAIVDQSSAHKAATTTPYPYKEPNR